MRGIRPLLGALGLAALLAPGTALAGPEASFGLGGNFGGEYSTDFGDVDVDGGYFQRLELDYFFGPFLGAGFYINYGTGYSEPNGDISMVEAGVALKPRITAEDAIEDIDLLGTLELAVGYRGLFVDALDDSDGLGVNLGIDLRARFENGYSVFLEPGFLTQPAGGNDTTDVTFSPIGYVILGFGYSFE